jgi:hypothetical protein
VILPLSNRKNNKYMCPEAARQRFDLHRVYAPEMKSMGWRHGDMDITCSVKVNGTG